MTRSLAGRGTGVLNLSCRFQFLEVPVEDGGAIQGSYVPMETFEAFVTDRIREGTPENVYDKHLRTMWSSGLLAP